MPATQRALLPHGHGPPGWLMVVVSGRRVSGSTPESAVIEVLSAPAGVESALVDPVSVYGETVE